MITVIMTTYAPDEARAVCAQQVVTSLAHLLEAPENISLHIADDGSPNIYTEDLVAYARALKRFDTVTFTVAPRLGIGGSLNRALRYTRPDNLWMYITDDWLLLDTLNLSKAVTLIRNFGYNYIRLGPIHPGLRGNVQYIEGIEYFLELRPGFGGFCFATRPFLASYDFYKAMGAFPEGLDAYETERVYAERARDRDVKMGFIGPWDTRDLFKHIGDVSPVGRIQPLL